MKIIIIGAGEVGFHIASRLCAENKSVVVIDKMVSVLDGAQPLITALVRGNELIIPSGKDRLMPHDLVYFISTDALLADTLKMFDKGEEALKRILIVGGGRIGYRLAKQLEKKSIHTKIIGRNQERCSMLAETLNKAVVLCADGSDQNILTPGCTQN